MGNNQATVDKLAAKNPGAMEFAAALQAIAFLKASPELPVPTVHDADFGDTLGVALQWTDKGRRMWCPAVFSGDSDFDWLVCGPPPGEDREPDDIRDISVHRGAPQAMVDYLNMMMREGT
ncbi:hypothetical protein SAMN05216338_106321 [Bradyrhizobium sp. Rc2d]|nr:hypothetical protein SAMN05216338_106321 [Bradyrhizobium sp. Rc2d]